MMSPHFVAVALEEKSLALPVALRSRRLPRVPSCTGGILRLSAQCGFRRFTCTGFVVLLRPGSDDLIVVGFTSFHANLPRTSCAGGILRLWALYEHVLRRLLRPHSREGEPARAFEASSAVTGCFLLRAVFVDAVKNEEDWRTRDEVRYSNLPTGGGIKGATKS